MGILTDSLALLQSLDRLADLSADLPYLLRRRAFIWAVRAFFPAHWVGHSI